MAKWGNRLKEFINVAFSGNNDEIISLITDLTSNKVDQDTISHYTNGAEPDVKFVKTMWEIGFNPEYYLFGYGDIYANNTAGKKLKKRADDLSEVEQLIDIESLDKNELIRILDIYIKSASATLNKLKK